MDPENEVTLPSEDNTPPVGETNETPQETNSSVELPQDEIKINPEWNDMLEGIPQEFHNNLLPHFKQWDQNYQRGIEKARNEVNEQFAPYKDFADNSVDPNLINQSLGLLQMIEDDPARVIAELQKAIGEDSPVGNNQPDPDDDFYEPDVVANSPEFQQLQNNFNALTEAMEEQVSEQQYQESYEQNLANIENQIDQLTPQFKERFGFDMDSEAVLKIAMQNMDMNEANDLDIPGAAVEFGKMVSRYLGPNRGPGQFAPSVLPTSGGVPQNNVDLKSLSGDSRENLVAQLLANANKE